MQSKSASLFFLLGIMVLTALACGVGSSPPTEPTVNAPAGEWIPTPSVIPRQPRTPTSSPASPMPTPVAVATFPVWVADFSDPILEAVEDQPPALEDDFPAICIDERQKWKVCSTPEQRTYYQSNEGDELSITELALATARPTLDLQPDLQNGYTLLNKGWFYVLADNPRKPLYAKIDNGSLILSLPTENEKRDFWVYNPKILQRNFVLQFDLEFRQTQPGDGFRFQFEQGNRQRFALELSKDGAWTFSWGAGDSLQFHAGIYGGLTFLPVRILVMAYGSGCAVYFDNVPLDYVEYCRADAGIKPSPQSARFHIFAKPGNVSTIAMDNIKVWDLDKLDISP